MTIPAISAPVPSQPTAVVLSLSDPWASSTGGTLRTRGVLRSLRAAGYEATCVFPSATLDVARPEEGISSFPALGVPVGARSWPAWVSGVKRTFLPMPTVLGANNAAISQALSEIGEADLLVVCALSQVQYRSQIRCRTFWIDFMDVWSDFLEQEIAGRFWLARASGRLQQRKLRGAERRTIEGATIVSAAGWSDAEMLRRRTGRDVVWLPTPVQGSARAVRPVCSRRAGFLGNFDYWPNREAFETLCRSWLPELTARGWRVVVAGRSSDSLRLPPGVECLGPLENIEDFYGQVDVTLAPIRLGGGIKVKVIESLVHGVPVVASSFALEGFPPETRVLAMTADLANPDFSCLEHPPGVPSGNRFVVFSPEAHDQTVALLLTQQSVGVLS